MLKKRTAALGLCVAACVAAGRGAQGQVLADKVPADAVAYAGWAGTDGLGPAYEGSHMKAFVETLHVPELMSGQIKELAARATAQGAGEMVQFAQDCFGAVGKSPTAIYVGPVDMKNPARPVPRVAIFSQVGRAQAESLAGKIQNTLAQRAVAGVPMGAVAAGDYLLVYVGDANIRSLLEGTDVERAMATLAGSDTFKKALGHLGATANKPAACVYVDGKGMADMVKEMVEAGNNAEAKKTFPAMAEGLGLNSLGQFAWAGGFEGADWHEEMFLGMRENRPGPLALLNAGPVSAETMKLIPKAATSAGVVRFDGMRMLSDITQVAGKVNVDAPAQMASALKLMYVVTGVDVDHDLLPAFGDEYVYYTSPAGTGNSLLGYTIAARLRDSKKGETALTAMEDYVNMLVAQRDPKTKLQFAKQTLPAPWDKVTAHVLKLENLTPCWAIRGDVFYFSMSLPGLQSAMAQGSAGKSSILENEKFAALQRKLGRSGGDVGSFGFADLEASGPETYAMVNMLQARAAAGGGVGGQMFVMPPLEKIMPALGPALRVAWADEEGYHAREQGPFPYARVLSPSSYVWLGVVDQIRLAQAARVKEDAMEGAGGGRLP